MKTMVKCILAILVLSGFMANLGGIGSQDFLTVDWPQDGSRADLHLTVQLLSTGQIQLTWVPYPDVGTYVVYAANTSLPVNSPSWGYVGETTGSTYIICPSESLQFWHVRPKVVATPEFVPPSGYYSPGQLITLTSFTPGAWFLYSMDYQNTSAPCFEQYNDTIPPLGNELMVIRGWAVKLGWEDSNEAFGVFSPPPQILQAAPLANSLQTVIDDMTLPGEGVPHGLDPWKSWFLHAEISNPDRPAGYNAFTCWGQLYEEFRGNPASNTRVQIRNVRAYYLNSSDHQWFLLQGDSSGVFGKMYPENWVGDILPAVIWDHGANGISATAGNGNLFHFWIVDRTAINSLPIEGIFVSLEARLIRADPALPDDRLAARYILNVGADWYPETEGGAGEDVSVGVGRFKYVTTEWKSFNFCTRSQSQMVSNPPPVLP